VNKDLIALIAAPGGWVFALVTLAIGYFERRATRQEDLFGEMLTYVDGGSQRRSIGISLEGIWIRKPRGLPAIVPLSPTTDGESKSNSACRGSDHVDVPRNMGAITRRGSSDFANNCSYAINSIV
jgi:hypothetical protein